MATYSGFTELVQYIENSTWAMSGNTRIGHKLLKSFGMGESDDQSIAGNDAYPRAFLELPMIGSYVSPTTIRWDLVLVITDIELRERTNEREKLDICAVIVNDLQTKFSQEAYNSNLTFLRDSVRMLTLTQYSDDYCAGIRMEFSFNQTLEIKVCDLSENFIL